VWLASQPKLQGAVRTDEAGGVAVEPGEPWWACVPRDEWPAGLAEDIAALWHDPHGDRQSELLLRGGAASDREELALALAACACTSAEAEAWAEGDSALDDPFAAQWAPLLAATADEDRNAAIQSDVNQAFKRLTLSSAGPRKPPSAAEAAPGGTKATAPAFVAPTPRSFCQPCR